MSAYGGAHRTRRRRAIENGPTICPFCQGEVDPAVDAVQLDHATPVALGGDGSDSRLAHARCNNSAGTKLRNALASARAQGLPISAVPPGVSTQVEVVGLAPTDAAWRVPWLTGLRSWPAGSAPPRFAHAPHPDAVGSYGRRFERWYRKRYGRPLLRWQRWAAARALEHDPAGRLCWRVVCILTGRQSGKSTLAYALGVWRLENGHLFGPAPYQVAMCSKDAGVGGRLLVPSLRTADPEVWTINWAEHRQALVAADGETWARVLALQSAYGSALCAVVVDEAWSASAAVVNESIRPTLMRAPSSQLILASAAHRLCTPLLLDLRKGHLTKLEAPGDVLIMEWSCPGEADPHDLDALKACMPHHDDASLRFVLAALEDAETTEMAAPDEPDPIVSWRQQYRTEFPRVAFARKLGQRLVEPEHAAYAVTVGAQLVDAYRAGLEIFDPDGWSFVAVEDNLGEAASVAWARLTTGGRVYVSAETFGTWAQALEAVKAEAKDNAATDLQVGASLAASPAVAESGLISRPTKASGLRAGLPAVRQLAQAGRLAIDPQSATLARELADCRIRETMGQQLDFSRGTEQSQLRPAVWAIAAAWASERGE